MEERDKGRYGHGPWQTEVIFLFFKDLHFSFPLTPNHPVALHPPWPLLLPALLQSFSPLLSSSDWYQLTLRWESLLSPGFYWLLRLVTYLLFSLQCWRKHCSLAVPLSHAHHRRPDSNLSRHLYSHYSPSSFQIWGDTMWRNVWKTAISGKRGKGQMEGWEKDSREKMSIQKWLEEDGEHKERER